MLASFKLPGPTSGNLTSRQRIHAKPVLWADSTVFNAKSGFVKKKLCTGQTFTAGTACAYSCTYCYVDGMVGRRAYVRAALAGTNLGLREVVIRRRDPAGKLRQALGERFKGARWKGKVIYASPLVDVAATEELALETVELCKIVLDQTDLDIRLLSKSPLLHSCVATGLASECAYREKARQRIVFGLSTGTLEEEVARVVEPNAPSVDKRLEALRVLQKEGWRTFGMLCPVLPQDASAYAAKAARLIDFNKCEQVWAEPLNSRRDSTRLTLLALARAGLNHWAEALQAVSGPGLRKAWEEYARSTFLALASAVPPAGDRPRLRFLQYTRKSTRSWWRSQQRRGAIVL